MDRDTKRTVDELRRGLESLRRRMEQRPVVQTIKADIPYMVLVIDQGNILETGQDGILWVSDVPSVPSAYDPDSETSFIDGIARAQLYINNVLQDGYVLVVNDASSSIGYAILMGQAVWCASKRSIPVDGGGSVTAYNVG